MELSEWCVCVFDTVVVDRVAVRGYCACGVCMSSSSSSKNVMYREGAVVVVVDAVVKVRTCVLCLGGQSC